MAHNDWDPDDLLDFNYDRPVPGRSEGTSQSKEKEIKNLNQSFDEDKKTYEELRRQSRQNREEMSAAVSSDADSSKNQGIAPKLKVMSKTSKKQKKPQKPQEPQQVKQSKITPEENAAIKKAQQEAYERYTSNYTRRKNAGKAGNRASFFTRALSVVYLIALGVFAFAIARMDILPFGILMAVYVILALLSLIIVLQLRKNRIKKWVRRLATVTSILLIAFYGVGASYALGTLSFLDSTSVENANRVSSVTKEPFNVCITGIDVKGKIDKEGRSDVNMIVTVNPHTQQILMTSIPRDYQIYMPDKDFAMDKLTHTGFYGIDTTIAAEEELLDTKINYYVKVNFSTVTKFIDAIGGIDVYSEFSFNPVKMKEWTVQEGMNHMNGKQALAFARERKAFPTGDNQRIKNQQAVFEAMIKKATSSQTMLLSYNKVISSLKDYFRMSFSSHELRSLIKLQIAKNPDWQIFKNTIVGGDGSLPTYSTGGAYAYVMTQDEESINHAKDLINGVLSGQTLKKNKKGDVKVVKEGESD